MVVIFTRILAQGWVRTGVHLAVKMNFLRCVKIYSRGRWKGYVSCTDMTSIQKLKRKKNPGLGFFLAFYRWDVEKKPGSGRPVR